MKVPPPPPPHMPPSRCRGAARMMSSTRRIISAASVALSSAACFTLKASKMPSCRDGSVCQREVKSGVQEAWRKERVRLACMGRWAAGVQEGTKQSAG